MFKTIVLMTAILISAASASVMAPFIMMLSSGGVINLNNIIAVSPKTDKGMRLVSTTNGNLTLDEKDGDELIKKLNEWFN